MAIRSLKNGTFSRSLLVGNPYYIPPTYDFIASATGDGSSNTITFSSIPQTYKQLQIIGRLDCTDGAAGTQAAIFRFNGNNSSTYSYHYVYGDGTNRGASGSSGSTSIYFDRLIASNVNSNNTFGGFVIDVYDYSNTSKNTTVRAIHGMDDNSGTTNYGIYLRSGAWYNTSAVTSISFTVAGYSFTSDSSVSLYGIKAGA